MCRVQGHAHETYCVWMLRQRGTGLVAYLFECPTGRYRWFQLARDQGRPLSPATRLTKPRHGWADKALAALPGSQRGPDWKAHLTPVDNV